MTILLLTSNLPLLQHIIDSKISSNITCLSDKNITLGHQYECTKLKIMQASNSSDYRNLLLNFDQKAKILIFGCGYILKKDEISRYEFPIGNFHTGKIPENRGRNPLFWDIVEFKKSSYGTLHCISEEIDMGRVINEVEVIIDIEDNPRTLADKLVAKAIKEDIFLTFLKSDMKHILSFPLTNGKGEYKPAFRPEYIFSSKEYTADQLYLHWRCYQIWEKILIDGMPIKNIQRIPFEGCFEINCLDNICLYASC